MDSRTGHGQLMLAQGGASDYVIVVAHGAPTTVQRAAVELQRFLQEISGAELAIVGDDGPLPERAILLGANRYLADVAPELAAAELPPESYRLRTADQHLFIVGGEPRGTLYGVYGLLEDYLGCRWYTPEVSRIPRRAALAIGPLDEAVHPAFEYRDNYLRDAWDGAWASRNRLNGNTGSGHLTEEYGGGLTFGPGGMGHTTLRLVPPQVYYDRHPEYYALRDGQRVPEEICWSSEGALAAATAQVRRDMRQHPEAMVFSVSQMDLDDGACQCAACQALAREEDAQMAPVLRFVNAVAEALADEFPDKAIIVFAYRWTRFPPRTLRPRDNVVIFLCDIECCFSHPMATCDAPANQEFRETIRAWSAISDRLWVWTYETNFHHYLLPFPNTHTWGPNARFFRDHHVTGLFTQDDTQNRNAEMAGLAAYVRAKLLWNPDIDADAARDEFLAAVYGPAAAPVDRYLTLLSAKVTDGNLHMRIYEMYPWDYLSEEIMVAADRLWDEAEVRVAGDDERLRRVQTDRLSLDYAWIEHRRWQATIDPQRIDHARFRYLTDDPDLDERVARFLDRAPAAGIVTVREGRNPIRWRLQRIALRPNWPYQPDPELQPGVEVAVIGEGPVATLAHDDLTPILVRQGSRATLRYRGYLDVPEDGIYRFYLRGHCPLKLNLRYMRWEDLVVEAREPGVEASEAFGLMKGMHPIQLVAVVDGAESADWAVAYEGPGMARQLIPAGRLWRRSIGQQKSAGTRYRP